MIDAEPVGLSAGSQWLGHNEQQLWKVRGDGDMVEAGTQWFGSLVAKLVQMDCFE